MRRERELDEARADAAREETLSDDGAELAAVIDMGRGPLHRTKTHERTGGALRIDIPRDEGSVGDKRGPGPILADEESDTSTSSSPMVEDKAGGTVSELEDKSADHEEQ